MQDMEFNKRFSFDRKFALRYTTILLLLLLRLLKIKRRHFVMCTCTYRKVAVIRLVMCFLYKK